MNKLAAASDGRLGYEFGGFVLDPLRRQLRRLPDGGLVELTPRVFDALLHFVEHPGQLLDRDELFQALWPGLVVEDNNLSQALSALRRALGDDKHDRYVLTVPRRGFRFICPVRRIELDAEGRPIAEAPPESSESAAADAAVVPTPPQVVPVKRASRPLRVRRRWRPACWSPPSWPGCRSEAARTMMPAERRRRRRWPCCRSSRCWRSTATRSSNSAWQTA
jgi:DNA-binding winged helix-turn-helix (wHTH) protein